MRRLYDSEIDVSITSRWDLGWELQIESGRVSSTFVASLDEAAAWFHQQALAHLPESAYARSFNSNFLQAVRDDVVVRHLSGL